MSKVKSDPYPNPIIFILESIQVISTIKDKAIQFLINSKKVVEKMTSVENENENYVFDDHFVMNKYARVEAIKLNQEKEFNKQVITILIDVTRTLSRQGLPFRGDGNEENGNFNQFVKLIFRYNPVLNRLLSEKSMRPYHVTYLGPRYQN